MQCYVFVLTFLPAEADDSLPQSLPQLLDELWQSIMDPYPAESAIPTLSPLPEESSSCTSYNIPDACPGLVIPDIDGSCLAPMSIVLAPQGHCLQTNNHGECPSPGSQIIAGQFSATAGHQSEPEDPDVAGFASPISSSWSTPSLSSALSLPSTPPLMYCNPLQDVHTRPSQSSSDVDKCVDPAKLTDLLFPLSPICQGSCVGSTCVDWSLLLCPPEHSSWYLTATCHPQLTA